MKGEINVEDLKEGHLFVGFRGNSGQYYLAQLPYEDAILLANADNRFVILDSSTLR